MHRTMTAVVMAIGLAIGHAGLTDPVQAQGGRRYRVEITNLTNAQDFTPMGVFPLLKSLLPCGGVSSSDHGYP